VALDINVDTSTAAGEMLVNVLMCFAEFERKLIGQQTREGLAIRRSQGVRLGRPALLPERVRRQITRLRRKGCTYQHVADVLNRGGVPTAHGGLKWYPSSIRAAERRVA